MLGYPDGELDQVSPTEVVEQIASYIGEIRPQVLITFGPDGLYGHPDHIAISQLATAAVVRAAAAGAEDAPWGHQVAKLYYLAWSADVVSAFQAAYKEVTSTVDGTERRAEPWRRWMITTSIDARPWWRVVRGAVRHHRSQVDAFTRLDEVSDSAHEKAWGVQEFYRVFSLVNGGRQRETDLFEGLRGELEGVGRAVER